MIKKRAMATARWSDWIDTDGIKRLETGYADNQPKWPYWVRPRNYSSKDWHEMSVWMLDTFGYSDWMTEHGLWVGSDYKYWFRDERDRTLFILKWS